MGLVAMGRGGGLKISTIYGWKTRWKQTNCHQPPSAVKTSQIMTSRSGSSEWVQLGGCLDNPNIRKPKLERELICKQESRLTSFSSDVLLIELWSL